VAIDENYRWYQQPPSHEPGISGIARDRLQLADLILPTDLRGKSFLDVGCAEGLFCFEATKRGAGRVLGIDKKERRISTARDLANNEDEVPEFIFSNFEEMAVSDVGQFDYVVCLNVIHHTRNPIKFIEKLVAVVRKRLILEIAGLDELEAKAALGLWKYFFAMVPKKMHPAVIVHGTNGGLCLTPKVVIQALSGPVSARPFSSIQVRDSYKSRKKTRYLLIADR